jgi:hypothetical protein
MSFLRDLFRVNTTVDWHAGNQKLDYTTWVGCVLIYNCPAAVDRKAPLADQAAVMAYVSTQATNYGFYSSGAFTRLREVAVSMRAPRVFTRATGASDATFTLSGRNLHLWTNWKGGDPEVNIATGGDNSYTFPTPPQARYWLARLNLSY